MAGGLQGKRRAPPQGVSGPFTGEHLASVPAPTRSEATHAVSAYPGEPLLLLPSYAPRSSSRVVWIPSCAKPVGTRIWTPSSFKHAWLVGKSIESAQPNVVAQFNGGAGVPTTCPPALFACWSRTSVRRSERMCPAGLHYMQALALFDHLPRPNPL